MTNKMKKPKASAAAAGSTPTSEPPPATQLIQAEPQQSEFQPTSSEESIITDLRKLSDALFAFGRCLTDVENHIDAVRTSIDSAVVLINPPPVTLPIPEPEPERKPEPEPETVPNQPCESDPSEDEDEEDEDEDEEDEDEDEDEEEDDDEDEDEEEDEDDNEEEEEKEEVKSSTSPELESLCKTMNIVGLKKYLMAHLSDIDELRVQVPKALKHSPNPARLVLGFIDKGNEKFVFSSKVLATLLALECFLLMKGEAEDEGRVVEIEKQAKEEAEKAALVWRGRMKSHGSLSKAHEMDARGLLLLISCFGIPQGFTDRDVRLLVQTGGASGNSGALRRSNVLMEKIPDIIQWMLITNMVVGGVDFVYTFGLEDIFNPRKILTSFLHNSEVSHSKSTKGVEQGITVRVGKKQHLSDLKSVEECLERHKIDPEKLLPGWQIDVRIMTLENEIAELDRCIGEKELAEVTRHMVDQTMAQKRKIDETESSGFSNKEMKPSHFANANPNPNPNPNPWPQQPHTVINHVDARNAALLERGGTPGPIYVLHGAIPGSMHPNAVGSLVRPVGGVMAMDGAGAGQPVKGGSFVGVHGATLVDQTHGQIGSHAGQLYGLRGSGSTGLPNTIPGDGYRPSPYLERSAGLPNTIGLPSTIPAPYQFAHNVPATELYRSSGSRAVEAIPPAAFAHPPSSLYWQR